MGQPVIDCIIPCFGPGERLLQILEALENQALPVRCIRLINTGRERFAAFLQTAGCTEEGFLSAHPKVVLTHIEQRDFDHGGVRNMGAEASTGADLLLFMTQDALPADLELTGSLAESFRREDCAVAYARQLPNEGEEPAEVISRSLNYPAESRWKTIGDLEELGIKTYFCSDVCAMYRADLFRELGGFASPMIFNEDMVFAALALKRGFCIRYEAGARVYHSHHYSAADQFHRNFDLGVSQAQHPEVFGDVPSEGTGVSYVKAVLSALLGQGAVWSAAVFVCRCGARLAGYRLGKAYRRLPRRAVLRCSASAWYWQRGDAKWN